MPLPHATVVPCFLRDLGLGLVPGMVSGLVPPLLPRIILLFVPCSGALSCGLFLHQVVPFLCYIIFPFLLQRCWHFVALQIGSPKEEALSDLLGILKPYVFVQMIAAIGITPILSSLLKP